MSIDINKQSFSSEDEAILALKAEIAKLEQQKTAKLNERLLALPKQLELSSVDDLIEVLLPLASPSFRYGLKNPIPSNSPKTERGPGKRMSDEDRQKISEALKAGESSAALTRQYGYSYAAIAQLKKRLGLSKPIK